MVQIAAVRFLSGLQDAASSAIQLSSSCSRAVVVVEGPALLRASFSNETRSGPSSEATELVVIGTFSLMLAGVRERCEFTSTVSNCRTCNTAQRDLFTDRQAATVLYLRRQR